MRINGRARIVTDGALLAELMEGKRTPKTATVVQIDEVLMHCGKAINRAGLWQPDAHLMHNSVPTVGAMMAALTAMNNPEARLDAAEIAQIDAHYTQEVHNNIY